MGSREGGMEEERLYLLHSREERECCSVGKMTDGGNSERRIKGQRVHSEKRGGVE